MKTVNVNDVLKILHKYGQFIFTTDDKRYTEMMDEIANLPSMVDTTLDKIRVEIDEITLSEPIMSTDGLYCYGSKSISMGHFRGKVLEIIDKYRKEDKE